MKRTTLFLIALGVLALHGIVLWLVADKKVLPQRTYIPPANFGATAIEVIDPETGGKAIRREYIVSTKFPDSATR
jgi:hypothetical protein